MTPTRAAICSTADTLQAAKAGWNPPGAVPLIAAPDFQSEAGQCRKPASM